MAFGTGHHATTYLMVASLLELDMIGKRALDMGSGTGVLAILAAMRGASEVDAIEIDGWACENAAENIEINGVTDRVGLFEGDVSAIPTEACYDFVIANINRNVLLADMERYVATLAPAGELLISGFLEQDIVTLTTHAEQFGMTLKSVRERDSWIALRFKK